MDNSLINLLKLKDNGLISIIGAGGKTSLMFKLAKELADSGKRVLSTTTTKIFMPGSDLSPKVIIADSIEELIEKSQISLSCFNHFSAGSKHLFDPGESNGKLKGFNPDIIDQLWNKACFDWIIVEADGAKRKPLKSTDIHEPRVPKMTTHLVHVTGLDAVGKTLDDNHVHRAKLFSNNTGLALGKAIDEQSIASSAALEIKKASGSIPSNFFTYVFLNKADNQIKIDQGRKIAKLMKGFDIIDTIAIASLKNQQIIKTYNN